MNFLEIIRGLVRPFLAVIFAGATILLALQAMRDGSIDAQVVLAMFGGILATIVGFYYGERAALKNPKKEG